VLGCRTLSRHSHAFDRGISTYRPTSLIPFGNGCPLRQGNTVLGNARLRKYLVQQHPDLLRELGQIANDVCAGERAPV
jgi:hypothetical protein